jgi:hypothetical protein
VLENGHSLVDKHPDQPTAKGPFILKVRRIARCGPPAVLYGKVHSLPIAEHTRGYQMKYPVTPGETLRKNYGMFLLPFHGLLSLLEVVSLLRS